MHIFKEHITPTGLYIYSNGAFTFHIPRAESARGKPLWRIVCYTHLTPWGDVMISEIQRRMVMVANPSKISYGCVIAT